MPHLIREHNVPHALAQAAGRGGNSVFSVRLAGGGEAKTAQPRLSSRQSPYWVWARVVPKQRRTNAAGFSKVLQLSLSSALLDPPVQWACSKPSTNQTAKPHCHSLLPTEWANLGSSSTCTNHSAFLLCVGLSGVAACVFRDFAVTLPSPILRVLRTGQNNLLLDLRLRLLPKPASNSYCRGRREGLGVMPL